eukprot:681220-Prorocentrum_minimum.AAC.1
MIIVKFNCHPFFTDAIRPSRALGLTDDASVRTVALNVHTVALNVHATSLNVHTVALNVHTVALNVHT